MTSTIAIHSVPANLDGNKAVEAAKILRRMYAQLDDESSLASCMDVVELAGEHDGWMPVASNIDPTVASMVVKGTNERLVEAGVSCRVAQDKHPDWLLSRSRAARGARVDTVPGDAPSPEQVFAAQPPTEAEPTEQDEAAHAQRERLTVLRSKPQEFSTQAYETAMALLCQCDGMPLVAAVAAGQLGRTTEQPGFYADVLGALVKVFPWLPGALEQQPNGVAPDAS